MFAFNTFSELGYDQDFDTFGMMCFSIIVFVANAKMFTFSKIHTNLSLFCIIGSVAFYILSEWIGSDAFHNVRAMGYYIVGLDSLNTF